MIKTLSRLALVAVFAVACATPGPTTGGQTAPAPGNQTPQTAKLVRIGIGTDEGTLTPYTYVTGGGWNLVNLVYDTLLFLDLENKPVPGLASAFQMSPDAKTWTVTLRDNAKWHDGRPVTPEDVTFSFEYAAANQHSRWTPPTRNLDKVEIQGKNVVFTLKQANPGFALIPLADMPIFPKHVWQSITDPRKSEAKIGSGPYKLVEIQTDQFYRMEANSDYFLAKPLAAELVFPVIKDETATFSALRAGELDSTQRVVQPQTAKEFESIKALTIVGGPGLVSQLLQFNAERAPFDKREVRQAIDLAVDKQKLIDTVYLGKGTLGSPGFLHPALPAHDPAIKAAYDLNRAKSILDGLGYRAGSDGIRTADGKRMEYTLLVQSNNPSRVRMAELIGTMLKDLGIVVNVRSQESASVDNQVWPGLDVSKGRDFDLAMWGWTAPVMTRPDPLGGLIHSDATTGSLNVGGFRSAEGDRLVSQLATTTDPAGRQKLLRDIEALIAREVPFSVLNYPENIFAYRNEAYGGWRYHLTQGIVHKLSFLPK